MPHEVLRKILPVAGWPDEQAAAVTFTGGTDPVLPTTVPHRRGGGGDRGGGRARCPTGLWQARTGRRQRLTVDLRPGHGVAAQRPLHEAGRGASVTQAQRHHGLLSHPR